MKNIDNTTPKSEIMHEDFIISGCNGDIYSGEDTLKSSKKAKQESNYIVSKSEMKKFILKAALEISNEDKFNEDPILKFYWKYYLYFL